MKFEFSEQEIGYIFEILKKRPFEECAVLIKKIQDQFNALKEEEKKEE